MYVSYFDSISISVVDPNGVEKSSPNSKISDGIDPFTFVSIMLILKLTLKTNYLNEFLLSD